MDVTLYLLSMILKFWIYDHLYYEWEVMYFSIDILEGIIVKIHIHWKRRKLKLD